MQKEVHETKKERYVQISRLLLDKHSSKPRNEVHNLLFEMGLFSNMKLKDWLTLKEVQESISYEIGIDSYPLEPLKRAASRLLEEKRIRVKVEQNEKFYSLEKVRKEQLKKYETEVDELYNKITNDLIEKIKNDIGELNKKEIESIYEVFDSTLSSIFTATENISTTILISGKEKMKENIIDVPSEFRKHLRRIDKYKLRRSLGSNLRKLIINPSEEMKMYLFLSANMSFIMKLLNLDPECQSLEKDIFSNVILYLDTNIIISALFPTHELHEMTCEVLKESVKLGIQLKITSRTLTELDNVLTRADNMYHKARTSSKSRFYIPENTIIETYVRYAETKGDTWETFLSVTKKYKNRLEKKYNVKFDDTDYMESIEEDKLNEMSTIVKKCSPLKSNDVAEHDAYHFLVIDSLRKSQIPNNIWFLSHDRSFNCVNQSYFELENKSKPCTLMTSSWMEVLFPFLSPDVTDRKFEDIFLKAVASDFFSMSKSLSFGNLTRFFAPFFDDEYLDEEDYVSILQNQALNKIQKSWKESDYSPEYNEKIAKLISELVDKRKDEKLKKMEKELKNKEKEIIATKKQIDSSEIKWKKESEDLDERLKKMEKEVEIEKEKQIKNRRFGELFIGVLTTIIIILLLIFTGTRDALTVLAIVGGGIAVGGFFLGIYRWITEK